MKDTAAELAILEDEFKSIKERLDLGKELVANNDVLAVSAIDKLLSRISNNYKVWGCTCTVDADSVNISIPVDDISMQVKLVFKDKEMADVTHQALPGNLREFPFGTQVYALVLEMGIEIINHSSIVRKITAVVNELHEYHASLKKLQEEENEIHGKFYALKRKQAATKDLIAQFDNGPFVFTEEALKLLLQTYSMPSLKDLGKHFQASGTRKQIIATIIDNLYV